MRAMGSCFVVTSTKISKNFALVFLKLYCCIFSVLYYFLIYNTLFTVETIKIAFKEDRMTSNPKNFL